jgi:hypothetical protein
MLTAPALRVRLRLGCLVLVIAQLATETHSASAEKNDIPREIEAFKPSSYSTMMSLLSSLDKKKTYRLPDDVRKKFDKDDVSCWNWAIFAFGRMDFHKSWLPDNVFGYLTAPMVFDDEVEPDWKSTLDAIRKTYNINKGKDRDAARLAAISSTMRFILPKYGLAVTDEKSDYSFHMYFLKKDEKDDNEVYDANWQHFWLEAKDSNGQVWVLESYIKNNGLILTTSRQPTARDDDVYGTWAVNLTGFRKSHIRLINEILFESQNPFGNN